MVERFLPLARRVARSYASGGEPFDDLLQVASLGLLRAIDRFDPDRGVAFTSFALPGIVGEVKRYFRDQTWTVHVPRDLKERARLVGRSRDRLAGELGRAPTTKELAMAVPATEEQVVDALGALLAYRPSSLEAELGGDAGDTLHTRTLGACDGGYAAVERCTMVSELLARLDTRDREVVRLRYEEDLLQREIGERVGLSQTHVSRILRSSIRTMRQAAGTAA